MWADTGKGAARRTRADSRPGHDDVVRRRRWTTTPSPYRSGHTMTTPQRSQHARRPEPQQPTGPVPALARAFALLGGGWTGLILAALAEGPIGFDQVRERVPGISDSVLVDRLQELTTVDLVTRTVGPGPPTRTLYALTPHGNAFLIPLAALLVWAEEHLPASGSPTSGASWGGHGAHPEETP
ncbi:winged helix-turn-helix transcriptional regulator [Streptomyces sp. NPDC003015]